MTFQVLDMDTEIIGIVDGHIKYVAKTIPDGEMGNNSVTGEPFTWIKRMFINDTLSEGYSLCNSKESAIAMMQQHYDFYSNPANMGIIAAATLFAENWK